MLYCSIAQGIFMNRRLVFALMVSLMVHAVVLLGVPTVPGRLREPFKKTEIYFAPQSRNVDKKNEHEVSAVKPPPFIKNTVPRPNNPRPQEMTVIKPEMIKTSIKEISLESAPLEEVLKKDPAYMDYYRYIREKIRKNAFQHYTSFEDGEVTLSFVILNTGRLETIQLANNSVVNETLKEIAWRSVELASPFPSFPAQLQKYPRLKFNISIQFRNQ
jgi:TonB family protein